MKLTQINIDMTKYRIIKKTQITSILLMFVFLLSLKASGQQQFGHYESAIDKAYYYLGLLSGGTAKQVAAEFTESGFQSKKDFKKKLSGKNRKWAASIIEQYGIPPREEAAISAWRVASRSTSGESESVNVSFYFKEASAEHLPTNDRISINLIKNETGYSIDGILFFVKEEYQKMHTLIQEMPF
jgi:hypothetical protein